MDIVMPQLGETVSEGTLTIWHKSVGDTVAANELLFEIGTEELPAGFQVDPAIDGVAWDVRVGLRVHQSGYPQNVGYRLVLSSQRRSVVSAQTEFTCL